MERLGPVRLAILGGTSIILISFFIFIIGRMGSAPMTVLYRDLDPYDSGRVASRLQELSVPFEVGADSSTIMVPDNRRDELLLALASDGLPTNGTFYYKVNKKQVHKCSLVFFLAKQNAFKGLFASYGSIF